MTTTAGEDVNVNRSKKQAPKKRGGGKGSADQEALAVPAQHADLVRLIRSEPRKADNPEDAGRVQLSKTAKATQLQLSDDRLAVTGHKGYRSVRATHGVYSGTWYCEWIVSHLGQTGHVRIGWASKKAELQAPVGFDAHGYGFRDLEGSKVHQGRREAYGVPFKEGDVIGCLIHMPAGGRPIELRERKVVRWKGAMYYEDEPEPTPEVLAGSSISFTVNGVPQGAAFTDVMEGTYYPCASIYTMPEQAEGATLRACFGPDFAFPPPRALDDAPLARPMSEVVVADSAVGHDSTGDSKQDAVAPTTA